MKRLTKQIFYGLFYLFTFSVFGFLFYLAFLKPAPTCFDGVQNQKEEGVDCGGPCAKICLPPTLQPLAVQKVQIFYPDRQHLSLLAVVENRNPDYAAKSFKYVFKIYTKDDQLISVFPGESFIYAGEIKYLTAVRLDAPNALAKYAELEIKDSNWVRAEEFLKPNLVFQNWQLENDFSQLVIKGRITNNDVISFSKVKIVGVLINNFRKAVGLSETEIEKIAPGETASFVIYHPFVSDINSDNVKLYFYAIRP